MVAQSAGMDRRRHEVVAERVHRQQRRRPGGVAEGAKPGTVIVDASTISPNESRRIGEELKAKGILYLDAPCTGLGVLRRHPEGKWRRRPAEIPKMAALQGRLLEALAPRVRPGGVLVYSVCTFTEEEGPAQLERFLAAHPDFRLDATLRTFPHREDADAFFAVRLLRAA